MARAAAKRKTPGNTSHNDEYKGPKHIKTDALALAAPRRSGRVVPVKSPVDATGLSKRKPKPTFHRFRDLPQELKDMVYVKL